MALLPHVRAMSNIRTIESAIESARPSSNGSASAYEKGFTLVELVVTLIIVGILAFVALPRLFDTRAFDARGYHDQALTMLRYAQKAAIAQRTNVFVNVDAASRKICLTYAADPACTGSGAAVRNPADNQWFSETAPGGVTFSGSSSFSFSALGRPQPDAAVSGPVVSFNIVYDGVARAIRVERETGYVY